MPPSSYVLKFKVKPEMIILMYLVHFHMACEGSTRSCTVARNDVQDACWKTGLT